MKVAVAAVVRNEARHIAEWIAYQAASGFDAVILFDNGSTDDTVAHALRMRAGGSGVDVRIHPWDRREADYQCRAYEMATRCHEAEFTWIAFFDTDEFLVLDGGKGLHATLAARQNSAAVVVPWAMFGSSGHRRRPEGLVIENYRNRSVPAFGPNRHIKTIVRPERVIAFHNPHQPHVAGRLTDLVGREVRFTQSGLLVGEPDYAGGKLHHYFTRSWEDWQAKIARGYHDTVRAETEFAIYDLNDVPDQSALAHLDSVRALLAAAKPAGGR